MQTILAEIAEQLRRIAELGGPVVMLLIAVSILSLSVVLYKIWQFRAAGVGRHAALGRAVAAWDGNDRATALAELAASRSYLAGIVGMAFHSRPEDENRLLAEAESRFAKLERGFRILDNIAQLAPLLGLFGTVLGMIEAFQALQDAGAQVDPSILAGGIWVALLTTAVGLVVAMPTAILLAWLESRVQADKVNADRMLLTVLHPSGSRGDAMAMPEGAPAHG